MKIFRQTPEEHVRWDSRFAAIEPVGSRGHWTIFRYETRIGGLRLSGTGANVLRGGTSVLARLNVIRVK